jgi:hypothetical protein
MGCVDRVLCHCRLLRLLESGMLEVCMRPGLALGPGSTNNIRVRVGPSCIENFRVRVGFGKHRNISGFLGPFISKEKFICIHTQFMARSENISTEWSGTACVANEECTWTRSRHLVPERGASVGLFSIVLHPCWPVVQCTMQDTLHTIRTAVIFLNQFSQCSLMLHSETLK